MGSPTHLTLTIDLLDLNEVRDLPAAPNDAVPLRETAQ